MDVNTLAKTGVDTVATSAVLLNAVPDTGDMKAPVIALVSSVVIQLTLKALKFVFKKLKLA